MPVSDDVIFEQSLECLWIHCHPELGDRHPLDVFNRLLAKNIRLSGWTPNTHLNIQRHQVKSRRERWTTDALGELPRGHGSTQGKDFGCPIVVAEYEGKQRLLDGNHRINRWIAAGNTRVHDVNIHAVAGIGQFTELPTAEKGAEHGVQPNAAGRGVLLANAGCGAPVNLIVRQASDA